MEIRNLEVEDGEAFLSMLLQLDQETKNMMFEPGERPQDLERIRNNIKAADDNGDLLLGAFLEGECVGFLSAAKGDFNRIKHSAYIVIGIRKPSQGMGLGSSLFDQLFPWAIEQNITRLELTVMCHNKGAFALYQKYGFEIEGTKRNSMIVDGNYVDEYYMARLL